MVFFLLAVLFIIFFTWLDDLKRKVTYLESEIRKLKGKEEIPPSASPGLLSREGEIKPVPIVAPVSQPVVEAGGLNVTGNHAHTSSVGKPAGWWLKAESVIGERWLVWVGSLVFAGGFAAFLKHAFERGWVDETARILLGFLSGLIFLGLGSLLSRKKYQALSHGLTALGLIIFYLTIFTAYHFYRMLGAGTSFTLFFMVSLGGMFLAVRRNSFPTAFLSTLGAFATPFMLIDPGMTVYYEPKLFSYLLIVNLGVLYAASLKRWRALSFFSFLATVYLFIGWYVGRYDSSADLPLAAGFSVLYFLTFSMVGTLHSILGRGKSGWEDVVPVVLNPAVFFLLLRDMLLYHPAFSPVLPCIPLAMALYHYILAAVVRKANGEDTRLSSALSYTATGLSALPVPMLVKSYWISLAWGCEALAFISMGAAFKRKVLRTGGLAIYVILILRFFLIDSPGLFERTTGSLLFLNREFFAILLTSLTIAGAAFAFSRLKNVETVEKKYSITFRYIFLAGLFWILNAELISFFSSGSWTEGLTWFLTTILWAIFSFFLLVAGFREGNMPLRRAGFLLIIASFFKVVIDALAAAPPYAGLSLFFNVQFLSALAVLIVLVHGAFLYSYDSAPEKGEKDFPVFLWGLFFILLFIELNIQIFSSCDNLWNMEGQKLAASMSCLWIVYGIFLFAAGFIKKIPALRIAALSLFGITLLKIFLVDLVFVGSIYRILLLIGTGTVLISCAYFYRAYRKRLQEHDAG